MIKKILLMSLTTGLLMGCTTTKTQYYWGNYEQLVYQMYAEPGEATPEVQILKLTTDLQITTDKGMVTPPGVNAHLGMMYAAAGNSEQALAAFENEKRLFPESKKLMNDMITRARGVQQK